MVGHNRNGSALTMASMMIGALRTSTFIAIVLAATAVWAQDAQQSPNLFDQLFGGSERFNPAPQPQPRQVQAAGGDLLVRLDRLQTQIRQLTGVIEQLQFRNQQLEGALRRVQEDSEYRFQELGARGAARIPPPPPAPAQVRPPAAAPIPPPAAAPVPGRRGDAFDPAQNPTAPGAPRVLGALPSGAGAPPAV